MAELPGKDKITVPVEKPPAPTPKPPEKEPELVAQLNIPAVTLGCVRRIAARRDRRAGQACRRCRRARAVAVARERDAARASAPAPARVSVLGPAAAQAAALIGRATASRRPSSLQEVKPAYTADAMRAKVRARCYLECVVRQDGSDRRLPRRPIARSDLRPRPGSDQRRPAVALQARHALRPAGPGPRHDRADVHAAVAARHGGQRKGPAARC